MRGYEEFVARVFDVLSPQTVLLLLIVLTGLVAALWYWFAAWVPRRLPRVKLPRIKLPRFRLPRFKLPRFTRPRFTLPRVKLPRLQRKKATRQPAVIPPPDDLEVTAAPRPGMSLADRLAAEGRYAEAIRERLRDTVRDLTRAGVITPQPGTTVVELTAAAAAHRPAVGAPLSGATEIFSEIWYGRRDASPGHDDRMRTLTAEVRDALGAPR
ncbi:DUF4129 domain-containing protein [Actinoplanes awajinensis]|uniref:Protein-glutamine gamma-glutamyltransferase-like C-terminal domain-containing protein n=1 Tax=Actinoplanes awajinensis subsp. mycoplanecinus TaxID=135947 RepID=A0A117MR13_9ACTN|nr:DUF4129 domain-containing protein [Actinoplanes awajinensis]KUL30969.1 hypothetical protein ADL15_23770 [Actinoplanes awajinensis subsp. mycoplanecinus]